MHDNGPRANSFPAEACRYSLMGRTVGPSRHERVQPGKLALMKNASPSPSVPANQPMEDLLGELYADLEMLLAPCPEIHPYASRLEDLPRDWGTTEVVAETH